MEVKSATHNSDVAISPLTVPSRYTVDTWSLALFKDPIHPKNSSKYTTQKCLNIYTSPSSTPYYSRANLITLVYPLSNLCETVSDGVRVERCLIVGFGWHLLIFQSRLDLGILSVAVVVV